MRCVPVVSLAVVILAGPVLAEPESGPGDNVRLLDRACQTGDLETAEAQFTPGCWSRKWDSGEDFCGQAGRKRFNLDATGTRVVGDRAVVTVDIVAEDRRVDRVYLYFVKAKGKWLIASLDENRLFVPLFLAGRLDPDFRARNLPADAGLDEIGKLLLLASVDTGRVRSLVEARVSSDKLEEYLDKSDS